MKDDARQRSNAVGEGHGQYDLVVEEDFFQVCKKSQNIVVNFFRPSTWGCETLDKHLSELCTKHWGTRSIQVNAEGAPFLTERFHVWMLPSVVLCKDGKMQFQDCRR